MWIRPSPSQFHWLFFYLLLLAQRLRVPVSAAECIQSPLGNGRFTPSTFFVLKPVWPNRAFIPCFPRAGFCWWVCLFPPFSSSSSSSYSLQTLAVSFKVVPCGRLHFTPPQLYPTLKVDRWCLVDHGGLRVPAGGRCPLAPLWQGMIGTFTLFFMSLCLLSCLPCLSLPERAATGRCCSMQSTVGERPWSSACHPV